MQRDTLARRASKARAADLEARIHGHTEPAAEEESSITAAQVAQEAHSPALPGLRFACAVWDYTVPRQHLFAKPVRWVPTHSTHQRASTALPTRLRLRLPRHVLFVPQECFKQASGHLFVPLALKGLSFSIPRRVKTAAQELTHFIL